MYFVMTLHNVTCIWLCY